MKVYVKSVTAILDEKRIREGFKNLGIKKNFIFSDCYRKCTCTRWKKKKGDIEIGFFEPTFVYGSLRERIIIAFRFLKYKKILPSIYGKKEIDGIYGFSQPKKKEVFVYPGKCLEGGVDIFDILKHELLHLKIMEHCKNKSCLFYTKGKRKEFCNKCQLAFDKLLEEIKEERIEKEKEAQEILDKINKEEGFLEKWLK